jgi:hypothetical protein
MNLRFAADTAAPSGRHHQPLLSVYLLKIVHREKAEKTLPRKTGRIVGC